jgi:hypothetical protein
MILRITDFVFKILLLNILNWLYLLFTPGIWHVTGFEDGLSFLSKDLIWNVNYLSKENDFHGKIHSACFIAILKHIQDHGIRIYLWKCMVNYIEDFLNDNFLCFLFWHFAVIYNSKNACDVITV